MHLVVCSVLVSSCLCCLSETSPHVQKNGVVRFAKSSGAAKVGGIAVTSVSYMASEMENQNSQFIIHLCEFRNDPCSWTPKFDEASNGHVYYRLPTEKDRTKIASLRAKGQLRISNEEQRNLWRDFIYVTNAKYFQLTSPVLKAISSEESDLDNTCVSFSCRDPNKAGIKLFLVDPEDESNSELIAELAASDASGPWQNFYYMFSIRKFYRKPPEAVRFHLRFVAEPTETSKLLPDGGFYWALGFVEVRQRTCAYGDVAFGRQVLSAPGKRIFQPQSRIAVSSRAWPGGVVPYVMDTDYTKYFATSNPNTTAQQKRIIMANMLDLANVSCIAFVPRVAAATYATITGNDTGCYSYVGYSTSSSRITNLNSSTCMRSRTIRHELLHLLGFLHEHQRPDRNSYVNVLWENIDESKYHNFENYNTSDGIDLLGLAYDYESIMHYGHGYFSSNGKQTIETLYPWGRTDASEDLSQLDVARLRLFYGCDSPSSATFGGYCHQNFGQFRCQRHAPCELGLYGCLSTESHDASSSTCKTSLAIGASCTGSDGICSDSNSACDSGTSTCQCNTGYYEGPKGDCLVTSDNVRSGSACTADSDCTYSLSCISSICNCQSYQTAIGDYDCQDNAIGSACSADSDCSTPVPGSACDNGTCQCSNTTEASYVDVSGTTQTACYSSLAYVAIGEQCDVTCGMLCVDGAVCRSCPLSTTSICTMNVQFQIWNSFPSKPPGYYVVAFVQPIRASCFVVIIACLSVVASLDSVFQLPLFGTPSARSRRS